VIAPHQFHEGSDASVPAPARLTEYAFDAETEDPEELFLPADYT
jgi:hypothetical protein